MKQYPRVGLGAVVFNAENKILLTQRGPAARNEQYFWECPGGGLKFGESVEQGIVREMKEEGGIHVVVGQFLNLYQQIMLDMEPQQHWISISHLCKLRSGEFAIPDAEKEKCLGFKWFSFAEIKQMSNQLTMPTKANVFALEKLFGKKRPCFLPYK